MQTTKPSEIELSRVPCFNTPVFHWAFFSLRMWKTGCWFLSDMERFTYAEVAHVLPPEQMKLLEQEMGNHGVTFKDEKDAR